MSFSVKHRIISEIEKKRQKGQILHFLSGDAILGSDNYFYSIYYGIYSLKTTLLRYYLTGFLMTQIRINIRKLN